MGIVNRMTPLLLLPLLLFVLASTACTTLRNRRDLYFPETVMRPYTWMLHHGIPKPASVQGTVTSPSSSSDGKNVVKP